MGNSTCWVSSVDMLTSCTTRTIIINFDVFCIDCKTKRNLRHDHNYGRAWMKSTLLLCLRYSLNSENILHVIKISPFMYLLMNSLLMLHYAVDILTLNFKFSWFQTLVYTHVFYIFDLFNPITKLLVYKYFYTSNLSCMLNFYTFRTTIMQIEKINSLPLLI